MWKQQVVALVLIIFIALYYALATCRVVEVKQTSMEPFLEDGDKIVIFCANRTVEVDDVVVYEVDGTLFVKRVVATSDKPTIIFSPSVGEIAVLGDHFTHSVDSLDYEYSYISLDKVVGVYLFKLGGLK